MDRLPKEFKTLFDVETKEELVRLYIQTKEELRLIEKTSLKHHLPFDTKLAAGMGDGDG